MKFKYDQSVKVINEPFYNEASGRIVSYTKGDYSYSIDGYSYTYLVQLGTSGPKVVFKEHELEAV